ncbi:Cof-type HAD-IIB family hydrolase [Corynebacterium afermentans]|uniref:Cof-type HAD-IIB family hydrolase n=1 Tax=Corynebacterium afermentans TaxID=38286 RepID=UPI000F8950DC|nr:Cof-type HAD-IIB family hydrolase [Corynebacterium afermentans]MDC7108713.1 Cof-type HAD-IIB family hydrolase [Corynebacterium afermentans]RUQ11585.1 HAD family hydrolase [Corynebacterium genitalium]
MRTPRLIALDMDGTLLDGDGRVPDAFWPLLETARSRGITLAPASGRQLATLQQMFPDCEDFIAENGAVVARGGEVVSTTALPEAPVQRLLSALPNAPFAAHAVVCAPSVAATAALPPAVDAEVDKYYASRTLLGDGSASPTIKIALYVESDAERDAYPWVRELVPELRAVVSGKHWVDLMHPDADKGLALAQLAEAMGVAMSETAAFGDYLNDLGMLRAAGHAVAMGNAHEDVKAVADEVVGTNTDGAAVARLAKWLS